jgi:hypothetical protein
MSEEDLMILKKYEMMRGRSLVTPIFRRAGTRMALFLANLANMIAAARWKAQQEICSPLKILPEGIHCNLLIVLVLLPFPPGCTKKPMPL